MLPRLLSKHLPPFPEDRQLAYTQLRITFSCLSELRAVARDRPAGAGVLGECVLTPVLLNDFSGGKKSFSASAPSSPPVPVVKLEVNMDTTRVKDLPKGRWFPIIVRAEPSSLRMRVIPFFYLAGRSRGLWIHWRFKGRIRYSI